MDEFEIIVDYKGMRRPSTTRQNGRLDLTTYEWQLQNYANLRERQMEGPPVVAGVLVFLNELLPAESDLREWLRESREGLTDIPCANRWRHANEVPDDLKLRRAIHVTAVTPSSQQKALSEFDSVVQKIETCRGNEIAGDALFDAWRTVTGWPRSIDRLRHYARFSNKGYWYLEVSRMRPRAPTPALPAPLLR
jgi:hypothetical protein